jgi:DNA-binding FadR family transcriptional regulator
MFLVVVRQYLFVLKDTLRQMHAQHTRVGVFSQPQAGAISEHSRIALVCVRAGDPAAARALSSQHRRRYDYAND